MALSEMLVAFGEEMPLAIPESLWRQPPATEGPKEETTAGRPCLRCFKLV